MKLECRANGVESRNQLKYWFDLREVPESDDDYSDFLFAEFISDLTVLFGSCRSRNWQSHRTSSNIMVYFKNEEDAAEFKLRFG